MPAAFARRQALLPAYRSRRGEAHRRAAGRGAQGARGRAGSGREAAIGIKTGRRIALAGSECVPHTKMAVSTFPDGRLYSLLEVKRKHVGIRRMQPDAENSPHQCLWVDPFSKLCRWHRSRMFFGSRLAPPRQSEEHTSELQS